MAFSCGAWDGSCPFAYGLTAPLPRGSVHNVLEETSRRTRSKRAKLGGRRYSITTGYVSCSRSCHAAASILRTKCQQRWGKINGRSRRSNGV
eukprot:3040467-Rhodomonas_salina.2